MRTAQAIAEKNNWFSVVILNWKEIHYLEYQDSMEFKISPVSYDPKDINE